MIPMNRLLTFAIAVSISAMSTCPGQQDAKGPAIAPQPRVEDWWVERHAEKVAEMSEGGIDLLMVGDSITQNFESVGAEIWKEHFEPRKAINLGFGGDRTNHVLWRLDNLPKLKSAPKAAVVLIGTNNICWGSDTPRQAAVGVQAVALFAVVTPDLLHAWASARWEPHLAFLPTWHRSAREAAHTGDSRGGRTGETVSVVAGELALVLAAVQTPPAGFGARRAVSIAATLLALVAATSVN